MFHDKSKKKKKIHTSIIINGIHETKLYRIRGDILYQYTVYRNVPTYYHVLEPQNNPTELLTRIAVKFQWGLKNLIQASYTRVKVSERVYYYRMVYFYSSRDTRI